MTDDVTATPYPNVSHDLIGIQVQQPGPDTERPAPSRTRRVAARAGRVILKVAVGYYVLCVLLLLVYRFVNPPITGVQLERRIEAAFEEGDYTVRRRFVAYERLPAHVPRAVMAAEDGRFLQHWGFDVREMRNAGSAVFDGEMPRGASTITQQLVKNLFGCTCRNPVRKLYDFALTPPAELILGKERIMELYLNNVEWGPGIFGIEAAARHHYDTPARSLSRAQAAGLAAILPNPRVRTPAKMPEYRSEILRRMRHRGW